MKPWEMILAHRYAEAVASYEARLRSSPADPDLLSGRARALLCLGRVNEALEGFEKANQLADPRVKDQPYLETIGAILWLVGARDRAIETFRAAVDGILDGSIEYADYAGGVSQGLLLWYAGTTAGRDEAREHAVRYLRRLAKRLRIKWWPGPLALLALGLKTWEDVLRERFSTTDLDKAISKAETGLLQRRELAQALFYCATLERAKGREGNCRALMAQCARLENPILEEEWYLARAEVGALSLQTA